MEDPKDIPKLLKQVKDAEEGYPANDLRDAVRVLGRLVEDLYKRFDVIK